MTIYLKRRCLEHVLWLFEGKQIILSGSAYSALGAFDPACGNIHVSAILKAFFHFCFCNIIRTSNLSNFFVIRMNSL